MKLHFFSVVIIFSSLVLLGCAKDNITGVSHSADSAVPVSPPPPSEEPPYATKCTETEELREDTCIPKQLNPLPKTTIKPPDWVPVKLSNSPNKKAKLEKMANMDPLILDLTGDGIKLQGEASNTHFDLDANGKTNLTGWVANGSKDAFLVKDINENGIIDDGRELFGNATVLPNGNLAKNGFQALRALDLNQDAIFTPDEDKSVMLWIDSNANGFTEENELYSLSEFAISSIHLNYINVHHKDKYGNQTRQRSLFNRIINDKEVSLFIEDIWFRTY